MWPEAVKRKAQLSLVVRSAWERGLGLPRLFLPTLLMSMSIDSYEACQLRAEVDKGLTILLREAKLGLTAISTVIGSAFQRVSNMRRPSMRPGSLICCSMQTSSIIGRLEGLEGQSCVAPR